METLFDRPCAIVDLETTGGHITQDRITEVGVILIDGDRVERFESLVNPGQPIPPFIENMTGISNAMVAEAVPFAGLAETLFAKLQGRLLIAHNVRFDYGFLKNEFKRLGIRFQSEVLCSVKLSRRLYPQHFKHNLDSIIARHQIQLDARHRALADAEAVYRFILSAQAELGADSVLAAATALAGKPALPPGLDPEVVDQLPDVPGVYLLYGDDDAPLYVGKGSNLRAGVLSHFAGDQSARKGGLLTSQIRRVAWHETLGEFGAMLLESQLIKSLQPAHNPRGRLSHDACSLQLEACDDGYVRPRIVLTEQLDFNRTADLYGLFRTPREARKVLLEIATAHGLCQSMLGVEKVTSRKGMPCCAHALGRCRGACIGKETAEQHNQRLMLALAQLRVKNWPYPAPVAVVETDEVTGVSVEYVFDRWCYLGSRAGGSGTLNGVPAFDLDTYKLLEAYLRKPLPGTALRVLEPEALG